MGEAQHPGMQGLAFEVTDSVDRVIGCGLARLQP